MTKTVAMPMDNRLPWLPERPPAVQALVLLVIVAVALAGAKEKERPEGQRRMAVIVPAWLALFVGGVYLVGWRWAVFQTLWEVVSM